MYPNQYQILYKQLTAYHTHRNTQKLLNEIESLTDNLALFIQEYGAIIIAGVSGTVLLIAALTRKLICKGKSEAILNGRITLLESGMNTIQTSLQALDKKVVDIDEKIHTMTETGLQVIGEVKESMARLEEAYKNLTKRQG